MVAYLPFTPTSTGVPSPDNIHVAAQMYLSASQTGLSSSADDKIDFDAEGFDTDGDLVDIANSRFVIQDTGYYLVEGTWPWEGVDPQQDGWIALYVNGSEARLDKGLVANAFESREIVALLSLTAGDTVEMYVNTGGEASVAARGHATLPHLRTLLSIARLI